MHSSSAARSLRLDYWLPAIQSGVLSLSACGRSFLYPQSSRYALNAVILASAFSFCRARCLFCISRMKTFILKGPKLTCVTLGSCRSSCASPLSGLPRWIWSLISSRALNVVSVLLPQEGLLRGRVVHIQELLHRRHVPALSVSCRPISRTSLVPSCSYEIIRSVTGLVGCHS